MPGSGTVNLYAQWINTATQYTLTYDAGTGGSGSAPALPTNYDSNAPATILGNTGPYTNSDPNKIFYGWNTAADGTGISYPAGSNVTMNASKTLYAQWVSATPQYTVTYKPNGATGSDASYNYPGGVQVSILDQGSFTRTGYTFLGWQDASGLFYTPGSTFTSKTVTLLAQWVGGVITKTCGTTQTGGSTSSIYTSSAPKAYRDTTNDTITVIIPTYFSTTSGGPYGTGNGPIAYPIITPPNDVSGNLISTYATAIISKVSGSYQISLSYTTTWTLLHQTQTQTIISPIVLSTTYWPAGETISGITVGNPGSTLQGGNFTFDGSFNVSGGCFNSTTDSTSPLFAGIITFYINFTNGYSTRVAVGNEFRWTVSGTPKIYTYVSNYARVELAYGSTPSPITGPFTPTSSIVANTA
jgi:hypothetical protein